MKRIAILGGGLSGLTAAYELTRRQAAGADLAVTLFEASNRLGGIIETVRQDGFLLECGPDGWVSEKPWARDLAVELGLEGELLPSNDRTRKTWILRHNCLVAMPDGMRMMVPTDLDALDRSALFSPRAIRAYRAEPGRAQELLARIPDGDESVASFTLRHFGREVLETIAAPLLSGVFGGDVHRLSVRAVMPSFVALERSHGSLILGLQTRARQRGAPLASPLGPLNLPGLQASLHLSNSLDPLDRLDLLDPAAEPAPSGGDQILAVGELDVASPDTHSPRSVFMQTTDTREPQSLFTTLRSGLSTLTDTLADHLPLGTVHLETPVVAVEPAGGQWLVHTLTCPPPATVCGMHPKLAFVTSKGHRVHTKDVFDHVLFATPLPVTRSLLTALDARSARLLPTNASSAIIVALAWQNPAKPTRPVGSGSHLLHNTMAYPDPAFTPPVGFGLLVPPPRGLRALTGHRLLATTFVEQKFAHRAPANARVLRAFFGGIAARSLRNASDNSLIQLALRELTEILGPLPTATPLTVVRRWPASLPQYEVGHLDRIVALEARLRELPGLHLLGNALHGVGVPDLIRDARALAHRLY